MRSRSVVYLLLLAGDELLNGLGAFVLHHHPHRLAVRGDRRAIHGNDFPIVLVTFFDGVLVDAPD